jgi:S1-C subfamily serine protease
VGAFCQSVSVVDLVPLVRQAKPAVVELLIYDKNGNVFKSGTGFFVNGDGLLVTNHHVLVGGSRVEARTPSGAFYRFSGLSSQVGDLDIEVMKFYATDVAHLSLNPASAPEEASI